MNRRQCLLVGAAAIVVTIAVSAWAYPQLPNSVPTHWDMAGNVNGSSSPLMAVAIVPGILIFTWLLMLVLPIISPKGFRLDQSAPAFYESVLAILAVIAIMNLAVLRSELTGSAPSKAVLFLPIGALFVILGNLMGKLRKNFFIGIRTPWTLASDEVWLKTNRLSGRLMVLCGLLIVASSFFIAAEIVVILASVVVVAVVPIVYSYMVYRRIEGFGRNGAENS